MEPSPGPWPEPSRFPGLRMRTALFWAIILLVAVLVWIMASAGHVAKNHGLSYSSFLNQVEKKNIAAVTIYPEKNTAQIWGS